MFTAHANLADRYRLDSKIAVGGMGEVWRGTDLVLDRPVAIKLLQESDQHQRADAIARFRAEARYAGSLSHPGIARVYDFCEAEPGYPPCLVMELVEGPSLASLLSRGPLEPARTMDIVAQTAAALQAAHAVGLVHRDVKPANLLLGPGGHVKVIDFGIAQTARSAALTGTGDLIGSPAYIAPERVTGGAATPASDLYALGVVAYECIVGEPPFGGTGVQAAFGHVHDPLPPPPAWIPPQVWALIGQLTAKDPALRPGSAGQVSERARYLRDALERSATQQLAADRAAETGGSWPAAVAPDRDRTLLDVHKSGDLAAGARPAIAGLSRGRFRSRVIAALVIAAIVVAGVIGWQLKSTLGGGPAQRPAAASTSPKSSQPSGNLIKVTAAEMVGQPAEVVRQELIGLGLRPRLAFQRSDQSSPGTVLSVRPDGPLPAGSEVIVTVAVSPHGQGDGHGHGNGDGGGGGGHGGGGGGGN